MRNRIIFISGGTASLAVADFVKMKHPSDNIVLYFTDTCWEHQDAYRLIQEGSDKLQLPLLTHSMGINPMQLMFEKKLVFNSMIGECSRILKQKVAMDFLKKGKRPVIESWRNKKYLRNEEFTKDAILYFGIGFDEMHREDAIVQNWKPFQVEMPLIRHNIWKNDVLAKYEIEKPALYVMGFTHNNCFARCVKAGQGHFQLLKTRMPEVFQRTLEQEYHLRICVSAYRYITLGNKAKDVIAPEDTIPIDIQESMLQELDHAYRDYFYDRADKPKLYIHPAASANCEYMRIKPYSFMKKGGVPYPLQQLKTDVDSDRQMDMFDIGGCGCFTHFE